MKMKQKIKNWVLEKPKSNFWFQAFITVVIVSYITPTMLIWLSAFQIGLLDVNATIDYNAIGQRVVDNIIGPIESLHEAGRTISINHPFVGIVLFYVLSNVIYVVYLSLFVLIINLLRFGTSFIYQKLNKSKKKK